MFNYLLLLPARQAFRILTNIPANNALRTIFDISLRLCGERAPATFSYITYRSILINNGTKRPKIYVTTNNNWSILLLRAFFLNDVELCIKKKKCRIR